MRDAPGRAPSRAARPRAGARGVRLCLAILLGLLLLRSAPAGARTPTEKEMGLFKEGNTAYQNGDFEKAAGDYQALLDQGLESRDIYYNLGNAALKQGKLGAAILNYRRALLLDPSDDDAHANLAYARARTQDAVPSDSADPFPWLTALRPSPARAALLFLVALNLAAVLFAARRILRRPPAALTPLFGVALALAFLFGVTLFYEVRNEATHHDAVVMETAADARSGPGADYTVAFVLHEGTEVHVHRRSGDWLEVSITPELKGWVTGSAVTEVE